MGLKPDSLKETKRISTLPISRLKRFAHTTKVKKDPNGKLQWVQSYNPSPFVICESNFA
jgi:hypothetical protein